MWYLKISEEKYGEQEGWKEGKKEGKKDGRKKVLGHTFRCVKKRTVKHVFASPCVSDYIAAEPVSMHLSVVHLKGIFGAILISVYTSVHLKELFI